ncbi:enoyl-CoA hydratase [Sorangium cellulosum]|uniref:Enoyl-CoA hydratase n=1 Tax=Sorangium cellulosum TaxID=56 RepID=A0A2L0EWB3_SORCE|nr:enoyl-CoA hydratase-related protein [Sorangium cellulosum]AUX43591.1 enoyl-CoA hydratase [Sorangium cellulosum]
MSHLGIETSYQTLRVHVAEGRRTVVFDRAEQRNSFNSRLLGELAHALDEAQRDPSCRMVVLEGQQGYFSSGLDFEDGLDRRGPEGSAAYMDALRRLGSLPAVVVASVDGQVRAGGLGFVAVSDVVVATPRSTFGLPEALWGLVPACVGLHLSRRIGLHHTKRLCLTTENLTASQALDIGLVDEVTERPEEVQRRLWLKVSRLTPSTLGRIKRYFGDIAGIAEAQEARAMQETDRAMNDPEVRGAIENFVRHGTFPWEGGRPGSPRGRRS